MGRFKNIFPPLNNRHTAIRRKFLRLLVNTAVVVGVGVLYYAVFSTLFDTPEEYSMRKTTEDLRIEYNALSARMDQIEEVISNIDERDANVFSIMFESEPYDLDEYSSGWWNRMENILKMNNSHLGNYFIERTGTLEKDMIQLNETMHRITAKIETSGDSVNNIPAIQPVINHDLTLLTASFGRRIHPFYKTPSIHNGVDFTLPEKSRVFATADGRVKEIANRTTSGLSLVIDHGNGYETRYNHLSEVLVNRGEKVNRGDIIALTGNSGLSLAPHLHYEISYRGMPIDPLNYFFMELTPEQTRQLMRIASSGMQSFD